MDLPQLGWTIVLELHDLQCRPDADHRRKCAHEMHTLWSVVELSDDVARRQAKKALSEAREAMTLIGVLEKEMVALRAAYAGLRAIYDSRVYRLDPEHP